VLVVFGPHKLPEIGTRPGKLMAEFRKGSTDFKLRRGRDANVERQAREAERKKQMDAAAASTAATESRNGAGC